MDNSKTLRADGHTSDCPGSSAEPPCADPNGTHTDIFCDECHDWFQEPHILPNGTDIAWPAGWSREQAAKWRQDHNLVAPEPGSPAA